MQALEVAAAETAAAWEQAATAAGAVREIIGGVAAPFLERMLLVCQDLPMGYLVLEAMADDRTWATWKAVVDARLQALGTEGFSLGSDRAQAVIQRANQGWECLSMPDCFPGLQELGKSAALPMGQRVRHAPQERTNAQEALARRQGPSPLDQDDPTATVWVEARPAEVTRWPEAHTTSRGLLETRSLTRHPCRSSDSAPQTTAQVASQLQATGAAIDAFAQCHQWPARPDAMTKGRTPVPALAARVDCW